MASSPAPVISIKLSNIPAFKFRLLILRHLLLALASIAAPLTSQAADDEIQVYGNDLNEAGELGQELHMNYVHRGSTDKAWPQQLPDNHMFRVTSETSYGFGHNLDGALYLPFIKADGEDFRLDGAKVRLRYMQRVDGDGFFWGVNGELGRVSLRTVENHWNAELRPVLGWHEGNWELVANPVIDWAMSENRGPATFSPALKLAYSVLPDLAVGVENYSDFGPANNRLSNGQLAHTTYLALDGKIAHHDFNFGIGHGVGLMTDKWVVKGIVGFEF